MAIRRKIICTQEEGKTRQSCKDECDINKIVSRFKKTGRLPEIIKQNPQYGDFSTVEDFQTSLNIISKATAQFDYLPSAIRTRFNNDPAEFLEFVHNPDNKEEMIRMGLAKKPLDSQETIIEKKETNKSPEISKEVKI